MKHIFICSPCCLILPLSSVWLKLFSITSSSISQSVHWGPLVIQLLVSVNVNNKNKKNLTKQWKEIPPWKVTWTLIILKALRTLTVKKHVYFCLVHFTKFIWTVPTITRKSWITKLTTLDHSEWNPTL